MDCTLSIRCLSASGFRFLSMITPQNLYLRNSRKQVLNKLINFNGHMTDPQTRIATAFNRSLRYGDGLFETMYWDGLRIQNLDFHLDRLFQGMMILQFDLTGGFTREFISEEIKKLCSQNEQSSKSRVRLNVFREDEPSLMPVLNKPVFIIESTDFPEINPAPLRLTLFEGEKKFPGILSNLKTNNYLLNVVAVQFAKGSGFDDAVILNSRGNICETSSSNIFLIQKGVLFTPALTQGCVAGTKRRELLEILPGLGFQVEETIISKEMIHETEEVFLTNAIRQVMPVICIDNTYYAREQTARLMLQLKA